MERRQGSLIQRLAVSLCLLALAQVDLPAMAQTIVRGMESTPIDPPPMPEPEHDGPIVVRGMESTPVTGEPVRQNRPVAGRRGRPASMSTNRPATNDPSTNGWISSGATSSRPGVQPTSFRSSTSTRQTPSGGLSHAGPYSADGQPRRLNSDRLNWLARAPESARESGPPQPSPDPQFGANLEEVTPRQVQGDANWQGEVWDGEHYPEGFDDCGDDCCQLPVRADDRDTICGICCGDSVVCQYLFARKNWENLQVFGGVTGFKGQPDAGRNGNFGFHEGFNLGAPMLDEFGISRQSGIRVIEADLSGSGRVNDHRWQIFYTSGFFHRPMVEGWQYGVVSDYLRDDFGQALTVAQLRWEWSYVTCCGHEAGAWLTTRLASDSSDSFGPNEQNVRWQPADMYLAFYRWNGCDGRTCRIWAGATGQGEAVIGSDGWIRLSPRWAVQSAFGYRIPKDSANNGGASQESWGLSMNVVCLPFGLPCFGGAKNPYRPLFNVADNSTFFVNQF